MKKIALFRDNLVADLERDVNDFLAQLKNCPVEVQVSAGSDSLVTVMVVWEEEED